MSLALKGTARHWNTLLHRWSGLTIIIGLLVAGLTGSVLAFRGEVDRWLNADWYTVPPRETPALPLQQVINTVEARFADGYVATVNLAQTPVAALRVSLRARSSAAAEGRRGSPEDVQFNEVFVDPYTAQILGYRNTHDFNLGRRGLVPTLLRLHYSLFAGRIGEWAMGIIALLWFVSALIGVALSWPKPLNSREAWAKVLGIRYKNGSYKFNYDLHRSSGLIFLPILGTVAFTGIYLGLPDVVKPVVHAVSALPQAPKAGRHDLVVPSVSPEQALATATTAVADGRFTQLNRDFAKGIYSVRARLPGDVSPNGNNYVYVAMAQADRVAGTQLREQTSAGQRYLNWQLPLHDGRAFGLIGQIIISLSALMVVQACITGLWVWWRKKHPARKRKTVVKSSGKSSGRAKSAESPEWSAATVGDN